MDADNTKISSPLTAPNIVVQNQDPDNQLPTENDLLDQAGDHNDANLLPKFHNTLFKRPHDDNDLEHRTVLDCGMSKLLCDVSKLPPLPNPKSASRRQETNVGITLVVGLSLLFVGLTHGVSLTAVGGIEEDSPTWWTFFVLIYAETGIALFCLVGLLLTDPGVVSRSHDNSFPIPVLCEAWIRAHLAGKPETMEAPKEYYIGSSDPSTPGDTYCVRCLVWRRFRYSTKYFHCSVCQRCVIDFDHHCSVFGRCIAGKSWKGNYKFFVTIVAMGSMGYLTTVVALIWSLSLRYKPQIVVPVFLLCLWLVMSILTGKMYSGGCMSCQA